MKKLLALAMAALMLVSLVPAALAEEADTVTYNLLDSPVTVGTAGCPFEEDGSFTIELEDDAFFPYEIQFTLDGISESRWFLTPEDTVTVGGHEFRVVSGVSNPNALTQIGLTVGGKYVPVYPEAKEFTDNHGIMPMSMLPIEHHTLYSVDLTSLLPAELKEVNLSTVFSGSTYEIESDKVVAFAKGYDSDDYEILSGQTVDLTPDSDYSSNVDFSVIVGSGDQFDKTNVKYDVSASVTPARSLSGLLKMQAYFINEDESRSNALDASEESLYLYNYDDEKGHLSQTYTNLKSEEIFSGKLMIGLAFDFAYESRDDLTVDFYLGQYESEKEAVDAGAEKITDRIWNQEDMSKDGGYPFFDESWSDRDDLDSYGDYLELTAVFKNAEGEEIQTIPMGLRIYETSFSVSGSPWLYAEESGRRTDATYTYKYDYSDPDPLMSFTCIVELDNGYPADGEYYHNATFFKNGTIANKEEVKDYVAGSFAANVDSLEQAEADGLVDITDQLFSEAYSGGYKADFSNGVTFTVFYRDKDAEEDEPYSVYKYAVKAVAYSGPVENHDVPAAPRPESQDTYFRVSGVTGQRYYVMPYDSDSYYYNGFQTVLLLDYYGEPVAEGTEITPSFYTGNNVKVFASLDGGSAEPQTSGESKVAFKNGVAIPYSASAENGVKLKNYWVTFLTQQEGPALFVNGLNGDPDSETPDAGETDPGTGETEDAGTENGTESELPVREVFFSSYYSYHHDIFIANIGNEPLTGIKVELSEDAENVILDDYWTVRDGSAATLAPFVTTDSRFVDAEGNRPNFYGSSGTNQSVAKIRLLPDPNSKGEIKGTLTISADGVEPVKIRLTGLSRVPKITTETAKDGVKFVHYSSLIQTNNMYDSNDIRFEISEGSLPNGVRMKPNGELYGVPTQTGEFTFTVKASYAGNAEEFDTHEYTIHIADNTKENVESATTAGYELTEKIPENVTSLNQTFVFHSNGALDEFMNIYKDGKLLIEGEDYEKTEGSTVITIDSQTIGEDDDGEHTISAEFRSGGDKNGQMNVSTQNYTLDISQPTPPPQPTEPQPTEPRPTEPRPTEPRPTEPEPTEPAEPVYTDVVQDNWFYEDVLWAYEEGLLNGVGNSKYAPEGKTSLAMAVTVLARVAKVDLAAYAESQGNIPTGMWYTAPALWAIENGLVPDAFTPDSEISRADMAILIHKFLIDVVGDTSETLAVKDFPDMDKMTPREAEAFKFLFARGIFNGVDENNSMAPTTFNTRAELATLTHRICEYIESMDK